MRVRRQVHPGFSIGSVDYEAGELVTDGESLLRIVGWSRLAEALNRGVKVHNALAASVMGLSYEEFNKRFAAKDKVAKNLRQAAKPANFGFPGRMGAAKLVLQYRKDAQDTPCPNGPSDLGKGVRGYKGIRFCILMDGAPTCGDVKVTEWKGRPLPPVCRRCIECAERLKGFWIKQWPEHLKYFDHVQQIEEGENHGVVVQHVSNRERGGATGNAISNGYFQGLLADLAKAALRRVTFECYVRTTVRTEVEGAKVSTYEGCPSPLFGCRPIAFQHDEIVTEFLRDREHDAAFRQAEIMVEEMNRYCPRMIPAAKAVPALSLRMHKAMEAVFDEHGRLKPWEPAHNVACPACRVSELRTCLGGATHPERVAAL